MCSHVTFEHSHSISHMCMCLLNNGKILDIKRLWTRLTLQYLRYGEGLVHIASITRMLYQGGPSGWMHLGTALLVANFANAQAQQQVISQWPRKCPSPRLVEPKPYPVVLESPTCPGGISFLSPSPCYDWSLIPFTRQWRYFNHRGRSSLDSSVLYPWSR